MKRIIYFLVFVSLSLILSGCYSSNGATAYNSNKSVRFIGGDYDNNLIASNSGDAFYDTNKDKEIKKVIFSAYLSLKVKNIDTANAKIVSIAKKYNGYVQELGTYSSTIRVKSDNLNDAVKEIELLGKITRKNISGQDVTDDYLDYQIRLENAEKARKRYLELLEKAENVEAAVKVEKELERLNETIELIKGKMNRINHLSDFSTITISIDEKKKPGIIGYIGLGLYYSVKWLFVRN